MNLLMVTREQAGDERFGIGRSLAALNDGLRACGCAVETLTRGSLQAEQPALLATETAAARRRLAPLGLERQSALAELIGGLVGVGRVAARLAMQRDLRVVHVHDVALACGVAQIADEVGAAASGLRWGLTQHSFGCAADALQQQVMPVDPALREPLLDWERRELDRAGWVCVPTAVGLRRLADGLGIAPSAHWQLLPHPRPSVNRYRRDDARHRLGWLSGEYRVLGVGMYLPVKRFERLIQACAAFGPELRLTLVGDGDSTPLRQQAVASGFGERLELVATDDIGLYLSAADLYVSTSLSESFGLANLEALVAGLPAIVSPVAAVPEVVGDAALLVEPEGPALAGAIGRLRGDAALRERLRHNAAARVSAWPGPAEVARRLLAIISSVGGGFGASPDFFHRWRPI